MDTHCQLMSDLRSLKIDYGSDNSITEFPLPDGVGWVGWSYLGSSLLASFVSPSRVKKTKVLQTSRLAQILGAFLLGFGKRSEI